MAKSILKIGFGIVIGSAFACIADPVFPYKYYFMDAISYEGKLNGPTPADDKNLLACKPTEEDKAPCTVMLTADFLRMKQNDLLYQSDLNYCKRDLKNCQASCD
jgi:hypothetical protein